MYDDVGLVGHDKRVNDDLLMIGDDDVQCW